MIGSTYGSAPAGQFRLPDLQGRVPVGMSVGDSDFGTLNAAPGTKTHTLTLAQIAPHTHVLEAPGSGMVQSQLVYTSAQDSGATNRYTLANGNGSYRAKSAGGGEPHNNIQPSRVLNYIIKI